MRGRHLKCKQSLSHSWRQVGFRPLPSSIPFSLSIQKKETQRETQRERTALVPVEARICELIVASRASPKRSITVLNSSTNAYDGFVSSCTTSKISLIFSISLRNAAWSVKHESASTMNDGAGSSTVVGGPS